MPLHVREVGVATPKVRHPDPRIPEEGFMCVDGFSTIRKVPAANVGSVNDTLRDDEMSGPRSG